MHHGEQRVCNIAYCMLAAYRFFDRNFVKLYQKDNFRDSHGNGLTLHGKKQRSFWQYNI